MGRADKHAAAATVTPPTQVGGDPPTIGSYQPGTRRAVNYGREVSTSQVASIRRCCASEPTLTVLARRPGQPSELLITT